MNEFIHRNDVSKLYYLRRYIIIIIELVIDI